MQKIRSLFLAAGLLASIVTGTGVLPLIQPLRADGKSLREIANVLNARGVPTARGGKWAATQIAEILKRGQ